MQKTCCYHWLLIATLVAIFSGCSKRGEKENIDKDVERDLVVSNEVSNSRVSCITEDRRGYIWIGTFRGLNRYDGQHYHQYFCTDDSLGMPDNNIQSIFCDSRGRLWVATVNGICMYINEEDRFTRVSMTSKYKMVFNIREDSKGELFAYNGDKIFKYNENDKTFENYMSVKSATGNISFAIDDNDHFVIANQSQLCIYGISSRRLLINQPLPGTTHYRYSKLLSNDIMLLSGYGSFLLYSIKTKAFKPVPTAVVQRITEDNGVVQNCELINGHNLLILTDCNGMFSLDLDDMSLKGQNDQGLPFTVPDVQITDIFQDSNNNIWLGTYGKGVDIKYAKNEQFGKDNVINKTLGYPFTNSVATDRKGNLWMSFMHKGLFLYDSKSKALTNVAMSGFPDVEKHNYVQNIFVDSRNRLWLAIGNNVVKYQYDGRDLHLLDKYFVPVPAEIREDKHGNIWVSTFSSAVYCISLGNKVARRRQVVNVPFTFIPTILCQNDGKLLIPAFGQKLTTLNPATDQSIELNVKGMKQCIRRSTFIPTESMQDSNGQIWIGTVTNGLLRYDPLHNYITHVGGLSCSDICSMEEDDAGNIWVSTMHGLNSIDRKSGKVSIYYKEDGLSGNEFQDRASCKLPDGTLVFGGTDGITIFNPAKIGEVKDRKPMLEDLTIHNKIIRPGKGQPIEKSLNSCKQVNLKHDQNSFSISFSALDYSENKPSRYFYKMDDFDKDWIDAGSNTSAYYANLPAGNYTFRVRIGAVDNMEASVKVHVSPAPLNSFWAWCVYIMLAAFTAWLVYKNGRKVVEARRIARKAELDKEQEQRVNKMNMSFFANIAHEFRTPLTMIAGPVDQLKEMDRSDDRRRKLLTIVQRSVNRMFRLVNQLLDFNKLENDTLKLRVEEIDVIPVLKIICDQFEFNVEQKNLKLGRVGLDGKLLAWTDCDKLEKIVINLMSNAIKYTARGEITLSVDVVSYDEVLRTMPQFSGSKDCQYVRIDVIDTGKGIPEQELDNIFKRYYQLDNQTKGVINWGSGIGLYLSRGLAQLHHGCLVAANRQDVQGSVFTYFYPTDAKCYTEEERKLVKGDSNYIVSFRETMSMPTHDDAGHKGDRPTILVVDDDTEIISYMQMLLADKYNVETRLDADSALQLMRKQEPNIVLCDVVMPEKNGYDLCKDIKQDLQLCHIPVILVTAKITAENQVEGLSVGADAYVTKPFNPKVLLALIESQLKNRERVRRLLGNATSTTDTEVTEGLSKQDKKFMDELYELMEKELSNSEFDVAKATDSLCISRTKLYYKVKGLTGETPSGFFRTYKLNRAAELIKKGDYTISEIADITGFSTPAHFSSVFKKQFGIAPSQYGK